MYTQYQNAPKFTLILELLRDYFTIPIQQIHDDYFDLNTCGSDGLDNWGIILDTSRFITEYDPYFRRFGFGDRTGGRKTPPPPPYVPYPTLPLPEPPAPLPPTITYPLNFGQRNPNGGDLNPLWGNFATTIFPERLENEPYRLLLKFVYLKYVSDRSFNACLLTINNYVNEKYPYPTFSTQADEPYQCFLTEFTGVRKISILYYFNFRLQEYEQTLFRYRDLLLRPAGVPYVVEYDNGVTNAST